ncbi:MAG TPA: SMC-Scp complex subunit ScpB [Candidatus Kapabacteria bacterium]|jgi:segregation and condensation protein B|nr:SMC-Scp complex subunit ScpB [Candidatus Kapabacteria bacterium]
MRLDYQSPESLAPVIEALLFASDEALPAQTLRALILGEEIIKQEEPATTNGASSNGASDLSEPMQEILDINNSPIEDMPVAVGPGDAPIEASIPEKKRKKKQLIELVTIHVAVQHLNATYEQQERAFRIVEIAGGYQFATRTEYSDYVARLFKEKSRRRLSGAAMESLAIVAYKQPVSKADVENIRGVNCDEVLKSLLEKNLITITGRAEAVGRPLLYGTTVDFLRHFGLHSLQDLPRPREIDELMKEESVRATTLEEAATEFVSPQPPGTEGDLTVDEAIAVARELGEREQHSEDGNENGIELDLDEMETISPGHPGEDFNI